MLRQGSTADPKSKLIIIPYSSTFIRFSHLYQEYHVHCTVITNDGRVWVGRQEAGIICFCFFLVLLYFVASASQSLHLAG